MYIGDKNDANWFQQKVAFDVLNTAHSVKVGDKVQLGILVLIINHVISKISPNGDKLGGIKHENSSV